MKRIEGAIDESLVQQSRAAGRAGDVAIEGKVLAVCAVPVNEDAPCWGSDDAPATIVVYSDFDCPFCARYAAAVANVKKKYGPLVRVVFKQFPLPFHESAVPKALTALAAHEQGRFWVMHDQLYQGASMTEQEVNAWAAARGLDMDAVVAAGERGRLVERMNRDVEEGKRLGVKGTPTSFVNGIMVVGAVTEEMISEMVDLGLARSHVLLRKGVAPNKVYQKLTGTEPRVRVPEPEAEPER